MNLDRVQAIADTLLYEGYILYPYRASAVKNRQRFTFGTISPPTHVARYGGSERADLRTECLVAGANPALDVHVRFLHPLGRQVGRLHAPLGDLPPGGIPDYEPVDALDVAGELHQTWQEVVEREIVVPGLAGDPLTECPHRLTERFPATEAVEPLSESDGRIVGVVVRRQRAVVVGVEVRWERLDDELHRITVEVRNETPFDVDAEPREAAMLQSLASAHVVLGVDGGRFLSLIDPPEAQAEAAAACRNEGVWPVLVGEEGDADLLLASPIILDDHPRIAAASGGDFFDGTEIDEMLTLRVMTLTDEEKRAMRSVDERARRILERTEAMPDDQMSQLHGAMRRP